MSINVVLVEVFQWKDENNKLAAWVYVLILLGDIQMDYYTACHRIYAESHHSTARVIYHPHWQKSWEKDRFSPKCSQSENIFVKKGELFLFREKIRLFSKMSVQGFSIIQGLSIIYVLQRVKAHTVDLRMWRTQNKTYRAP